jgi:CrcB protein
LTWRAIALVAAGGAFGSVLRYVISHTFSQRVGPPYWATFLINIAGSFAIGVVAELALTRASWVSPDLRVFLAVGVLGGFTTFSTYSLEIVGLVGQRAFGPALAYALGSLVFGFAAAFCGLILARTLAA